ncbi:MAG: sulfatase-like hydrolase/transferase [Spirochaetes bacterium]|nr:sulfatase-like hydrolase/transferase [Spirochaetota bacterium]
MGETRDTLHAVKRAAGTMREHWQESRLPDLFLGENDSEGSPIPFYLILLAISHLWIPYHLPSLVDHWSIISFSLQQLFIFSLALYIDSKSGRLLRYLVAGASFLYSIMILLIALVLSVTGTNLTESLEILLRCNLGEDFLFMLHEAGFSLKSALGIVILLANILVIGSVIRRFLKKMHPAPMVLDRVLPAIVILAAFLFVLEQAVSWQHPQLFSRRNLPLYLELFRKNSQSLTLEIPPHRGELQTAAMIERIAPPLRKKNVVIFVLESFRQDMVEGQICPHIHALSRDSLTFPNAYCDAIYTSLSWNVIFLDRPAYTLDDDIDTGEHNPQGSVILRIMKRAGYSTHFVASANFNWNLFYRRFTGNGSLLDSYYSAYDAFQGKERNELDRFTTDRAVSLIRGLRGSPRPFLLYVQLDSSHFQYYFDRDAELFKDYPQILSLKDIRVKHNIGYLFDRYKNSTRNVDNRIGEIIAALRETGAYENTVIAVVSDHGEGFAPGRIGHHVFHNDIKKLLLQIRLPGTGARRITRPVSHRDMFPTILDYLKIPGLDKRLLLGRSVFDEDDTNAILTMHGSESLAELNILGFGVLFRTSVRPESITLTPYGITDYNGRYVEYGIEKCRWKDYIKTLIESNGDGLK